jgi:hypothetical protein
MTTTYEVKDGARTLQFEGTLLGKSSSRKRHSSRWIEFEIYRTTSGSYVISRIGVSITFHSATCYLVSKYGLTDELVSSLDAHAFACDACNPTLELPIVFPEKNRYWAQVCDEPSAVIDALYKYGDGGARYLTWVARQVIEEAADNDDKIDSAYRFERIP